jgi:hypothetical protein
MEVACGVQEPKLHCDAKNPPSSAALDHPFEKKRFPYVTGVIAA